MLIKILILLGGLVVLIAGGEFLVRGASRMALRLHISSLVVGLTIVSFGTSAPELFISIQSALSGSPDMAMGNVIGSNICNIAFILGLMAFFSPINVNKDSIKIDWPVAMGSSLLLYLLILENYLERIEGIIFLVILAAYIFYLVWKSRKEKKAAILIDGIDEKDIEKTSFKAWAVDVFFIVIGSLGLYFGSDWFVTGSKDIFLDLGVEERVIGLVVLALGTSLPELVTSIAAALRKNTDLAVGNLVGSNIFNILSILGITSIIKAIHVSPTILNFDMIWMMAITFVLLPLMLLKRRLGKLEGGVLLSLYFIYTYLVLWDI